jgi:hypothetical protein
MDGRRPAEEARVIDPALKVPFTSGNPVASAEAALLAKPYRHLHLAAALRDVPGSIDPAGCVEARDPLPGQPAAAPP